MFCPILQISGSSYSKTRFFSIPCRIKHHIQSVFGHSHTGIFAAPRPILIDWYPVLDEKNELMKIIQPRKGHFDSLLTECGPPAVRTKHGIVLMYNGKNSGKTGDADYPANAYCAGQLLLDGDDPYKVLDRLDKPFFAPEASFEKSGQYKDGTVFIEGLVYHKRKLYLYYGCADSRVAVAVCDDVKKLKIK